jgi:hypothetical protein
MLCKGALIVVIAGCVSQAVVAHAQPAISGVSGSGTLTVVGSGFGTKSSPGPLKFDTFENGADGSTLASVDSRWQPYDQQTGVRFSNVLAHSGSLAVRAVVTNGESFFSNYFTFSPASDEVFISYWWRTDNADSSDHTIVKMTRINSSAAAGGGGVYNGNGGTTLGGTFDLASNSGPYVAYDNGPTDEAGVHYFAAPPRNQWFRVDMYKKLGTPGTANGVMDVKMFGVDAYADNAALTRAAGYSFKQDTILLGTMDGSDQAHNYQIYIDDMYIDTSRARVELCDSATWSARQHCEIQPATAWSNTSISFSLNAGSFSRSASAYLYVVNSAGTANSNGFLVSSLAGGGGSVAPPSAPTHVTIK